MGVNRILHVSWSVANGAFCGISCGGYICCELLDRSPQVHMLTPQILDSLGWRMYEVFDIFGAGKNSAKPRYRWPAAVHRDEKCHLVPLICFRELGFIVLVRDGGSRLDLSTCRS